MKRRYSSLNDTSNEHSVTETKHPNVCEAKDIGNHGMTAMEFTETEINAGMWMDFDEDWPDEHSDSAEQLFSLDLSSWKRCKILTAERFGNEFMKVHLQDAHSKDKALCHLLPPWNTCDDVSPGQIVSVLAIKDNPASEHFVVNSNYGFFVIDPDTLVSGTTVVGALFCQRRGVLQELFRMSEPENTQMIIGTLAHYIFQKCLLDKSCKTLTDVKAIATNVMKSKKVVSSLYAANMSTQEAYSSLQPYLDQTEMFLKNHVRHQLGQKGSPSGTHKDTEKTIICEINDIEENIWCHQLGVKGKIDATVSVACDAAVEKCEKMPLELKTGRASYSFEHLGQLALYEMMMDLVGHEVSAGLLLYLRDGKCSRVAANRNMKRDLIMLRNEVTRSLSSWMVAEESPQKGQLFPMKPKLPEPINNERACGKCPYNTVCITMLRREREDSVNLTNHGLSKIAEEACGYLRNSDIDYFIQWTGLIHMELQESIKSQSKQNIWNSTPLERSEKGRCIFGLVLLTPVRPVDDSYFHTFKVEQFPSDGASSECSSLSPRVDVFDAGEYVTCSTAKRAAVASGYIISHAGHELVVSFERDLSANYGGERFILDQCFPYRSTSFDLSNLAMLLVNGEQAARYRSIIIDRQKPIFSDGILSRSMIPKAKEILKKLNRHQKTATLKAAATESYCLLKGLPGTGKTQTIVGLIRLLSLLGQSILLTSNTHSAVDNVLKRLLPFRDVKFIRLGSLDRIDPAITPFAEHMLTENCDSPEQMEEAYELFKVVAVTCQGTGHPLISKRLFDYCIVDEATQVFQPSLIRPLLRCKRFLLVGDPEQLPPVVKSVEARMLGASESMFHRLDQEGSFYILPTQYRMNRVLTKLANDFAYDGKLICGNDIVENSTLSLPNLENVRRMYELERWLMKIISNQIDLSAVIVDTGNTTEMNQNYLNLNKISSGQNNGASKNVMKCTNVSEIAAVVYICWAFMQAGVEPESIGIIAPFRAQVDLIRKHLEYLFQKQKHHLDSRSNYGLGKQSEDGSNCSSNIEVNTVDQYQGKDKRIIIFSCTKSTDSADAPDHGERKGPSGFEILSDKRRLTVAITRAKEKLIVVGDRKTLDSYEPFKKLFQVASRVGTVSLMDKKDGFEWNTLFEFLISLCE